MTDLTQSIHTYLTTASTSRFLQKQVEVIAGWEGRDNLLWRVRTHQQDAVIKLYLDAGQARSRRQFDAHTVFARLGIAPTPLWYDRYPHGLARQVMVYAWVEGKAGLETRDQRSEIGRLAEVIAQVHSSDASNVRRFCPHPLNLDIFWKVESSALGSIATWLSERRAVKLRGLFQQIAAVCNGLVEVSLPLWQQLPPTPVHGDLRLENAVTTSYGSLVLLDWEMFGLGDPSLEIATFLNHGELANSDDWLEHYLSLVDQPFLAQRIAVYRRLLPFQSLCYLLNGLRSMDFSETKAEQDKVVTFLLDTLQVTFRQAALVNGVEDSIEQSDFVQLREK